WSPDIDLCFYGWRAGWGGLMAEASFGKPGLGIRAQARGLRHMDPARVDGNRVGIGSVRQLEVEAFDGHLGLLRGDQVQAGQEARTEERDLRSADDLAFRAAARQMESRGQPLFDDAGLYVPRRIAVDDALRVVAAAGVLSDGQRYSAAPAQLRERAVVFRRPERLFDPEGLVWRHFSDGGGS